MTLTQVGWQLAEGIRALASLLNMLVWVASSCRVSYQRMADWDCIGLSLDGKKYWIGLSYDEPEKLWFHTRCRIDSEAAGRLGEGELSEENWIPGRYCWWRGAELSSGTVHFFERSKVSQMRWLGTFLRECLKMARSIEASDQPPIPEEIEVS